MARRRERPSSPPSPPLRRRRSYRYWRSVEGARRNRGGALDRRTSIHSRYTFGAPSVWSLRHFGIRLTCPDPLFAAMRYSADGGGEASPHSPGFDRRDRVVVGAARV